MTKQLTTLLPALLLFFCGAQHALAQEDAPWYEGIELHSFVSTSYEYNFNNPQSGMNTLRIFDTYHNTFVFDVFELGLQRLPERKGEAGFRFDLITGTTIPKYTASWGLFGGENIDVKQAYVSYVVPVGDGLTLDAGKFLTHMGYELIEGYDGYNDNVSRSFLFGLAVPFAHTGLRASYSFSEQISAMVMLANGWDNALDNNKNKTVGAQLGVSPVDDLGLYVNYIYGAERDGNNSDNRSVLDFVGTYSISELLSVGLNFDYGVEDGLGEGNDKATWSGYAGYVRLDLSDAFSLSLRGEQFDDADGARTGLKQKLTEFTLTPEYRPAENFVIRGDLRFDSSDQSVFEKTIDPETGFVMDAAKSQNTVSINLLYYL